MLGSPLLDTRKATSALPHIDCQVAVGPSRDDSASEHSSSSTASLKLQLLRTPAYVYHWRKLARFCLSPRAGLQQELHSTFVGGWRQISI